MKVAVETFRSLEDAESTWTAFQKTGTLYAFQTFEWLEAWYRHVGTKDATQPHLVAVYDDAERPLYFFPFGIKRRGALRILTWLGEPLNDYGAPIIATRTGENSEAANGGSFTAVWGAVAETFPPVDAVILPRMPLRVNEHPNPVCELSCHRHHSSAHFVRLTGTWEEFYERRAGPKTRSTDRRKYRRLSENGDVTCRITDGSDAGDVEMITRAMIEQKQHRYEEIAAKNVLADDGLRRFFSSAPERLIASGQLHLAGLFIDGEAITTHWGMVHDGRFYYYMPSFESKKWQRYSPGRLLLFNLFQWCFQNEVRVFDFTIGDESYKRDWCDETMPLFEYFEPMTAKGRIYGLYYRPLKTLLRNSTFLAAARRIRRWLYKLRYSGS